MTDESNKPKKCAKLKQWSKSGLVEEAVVRDHGTFQTEEFDREDKGELVISDLVRRSDHEDVVEAARREERQKILEKIDEKMQKLVDRANKAEEKGVEINLDIATEELGQIRDEVQDLNNGERK